MQLQTFTPLRQADLRQSNNRTTMLKSGGSYHKLGVTYLKQINTDQLHRYFVNRLKELGLDVTAIPATAA